MPGEKQSSNPKRFLCYEILGHKGFTLISPYKLRDRDISARHQCFLEIELISNLVDCQDKDRK